VANVFSANVSHPSCAAATATSWPSAGRAQDLEDRTTLPYSSDKHTLNSGRFQLSGDMRDSMAGVTVYSASLTGGRLHEEDPDRVAIDDLTFQTEGRSSSSLFGSGCSNFGPACTACSASAASM
jgi:hypothetical protein